MSVDSTDELEKVLYKIGTGINAVYTSEATTPWCTIHYFKLDKGVCVGCEAKAALQSLIEDRTKVTGETSDGYHTFNELYAYRLAYNAALFNEWAAQGKYGVHKSKRHSDGELCFGGGWFVVVAQLPTGQITNHYQEDHWPLFDIERRDKAAEWDGHTPADVAKRLREYLEKTR